MKIYQPGFHLDGMLSPLIDNRWMGSRIAPHLPVPPLQSREEKFFPIVDVFRTRS